jgi:hypothetical protein
MKISTFMGASKDLNLIYVVERDIFYKTVSTSLNSTSLAFGGNLTLSIPKQHFFGIWREFEVTGLTHIWKLAS